MHAQSLVPVHAEQGSKRFLDRPGSCCNHLHSRCGGGQFQQLVALATLLQFTKIEPEVLGLPAEGSAASAAGCLLRCPAPASRQSHAVALPSNVLFMMMYISSC